MKYKREKSCSPLGLQSFIDQITNGIIDAELELEMLKHNVLRRLKLCINDRLYEQQFIENSKTNKKNIRDHLNIIKAYYDFYIKLDKYFLLVFFLIYTKEAELYKIPNKNFKHSVAFIFKNGDILPFTDIFQDTSYLFDLDFSKNFCTSYNTALLNQNTYDWEKNEMIKEFIEEIDKK